MEKTMNSPRTIINASFGALLIITNLIYLLNLFDIVWFEEAYLFLIMALAIPPVIFSNPLRKDENRVFPPWYDIVIAVVGISIGLFFFLNGQTMRIAGWEFGVALIPVILAFILLLILMECTRRTNGWIIFFLCIFFIFMPMFSSYLPGMFMSLQFDFGRTISAHVMGPDSVVGPVGRVCGRILIGYLLFSGVLSSTGGGQFFLDLAASVAGKFRGAAAKVSIISSGLFGMLTGSVISNVMTTGSFTIPSMKKQGYASYYAAAVETCASTGGTIMPPVMGAVAFIMAELTETPYWTICLAAALPAILYYIILYAQAHSYAGSHNLSGMKKEEIPAAKTTLKWGWPYIFTIAVLLWFLGYEQQEALAPYYATVALLIASLIPKDARPNRRTLLNMLANSGKIIAEICILLFAIGVIFGALSIVGLATTISFELANLAGGNIWLLPLLTAVAGYILGMGLPASASYILLAVALAPAMIKVGFGVVPTHLFCLYCGMLSFIIPPVALGAIAGAKVAGEKNVMKVGFTAMRLGSGLFIMPFYFIFVPGLLLGQASFGTTMIDFVITGIGLFVAASALERYFINFSLSKVESVLIIAGGLLIAYPDIWTTLSGACLAGIPLIMAFIRKRKIALPSAS